MGSILKNELENVEKKMNLFLIYFFAFGA